MKRSLLIFVLLTGVICDLIGQNISGLSHCLLFDSNLEKDAFQRSNENECDPLIFLLAFDPKVDSSHYGDVQKELTEYAGTLRKKKTKFRNELKYLQYVFNDVHRKYLKDYRSIEAFTGIFNSGSYNCVSGTALYACLLNQLDFTTTIYETRYHIFLLVEGRDSTRVLFETTDPMDGFVNDRKLISKRINHYLEAEQEQVAKRLTLSAPFDNENLLEDVSLKELAGLHYYNLGIDFINKKNYYDAFRALKKASLLYPSSQRIKDFLQFTHSKYEWELSNAFVNN